MNQLLDEALQQNLASSIAHWAEMTCHSAASAHCASMQPHVLMRPKVFHDGNQWCALYGDNLQKGVCGFGDTPEAACQEFDTNWRNEKAALPPQAQGGS